MAKTNRHKKKKKNEKLYDTIYKLISKKQDDVYPPVIIVKGFYPQKENDNDKR
jgi:hypothetical protein